MADVVVAVGAPTARDVTLVERAKTGDAVAFDLLIRPRLRRHLGLALSILTNEADARDVVQDACLHAWRELPRLRDPARFDAWLTRIVVNGSRSALRQRRRSWVREIPADGLGPGSEPATKAGPIADELSDVDAVRRAFARLDADKRSILVLHHVRDLPIRVIANVLGIPEGTVKWRLHSARRALERALEVERR